MIAHELKTWPDPFRAVASGRKKHEVRKFDRNFEVGDLLILQEYDPNTNLYSGQELKVHVSYITPPGTFGLPPDIGVLSIDRLSPDE